MKRFISALLIATIMFCMLPTSFIASAKYFDNVGTGDDILEDDLLVTSDSLFVNRKYCVGIKQNSVPTNAINLFDNNTYIKFYDGDTELDYNTKIKTGDTVCLSVNGLKYENKTIGISGDVDGNGKETVNDIVLAVNNIVNGEELSELQILCGDIDRNKTINVSDVLKMRDSILYYDSSQNEYIDFSSKEIFINDNLDKFKVQGRAYKIDDTNETKGGVGVYFPVVGVEFNAICEGDVYVNIIQNAGGFRAYIDGEESGIKWASGKIKIASGLERGLHEIKLFSSDESSKACISSFILNGVLYNATQNKTKKIKFIGDSITCGNSNVIKLIDDKNNTIIEDHDGEIDKVCVKIIEKQNPDNYYIFDVDYSRYNANSNCYTVYDEAGNATTYSFDEFTAMHQFYRANGDLIYETEFLGQGYNSNPNVKYLSDSSRSYAYLTALNLDYDWEMFSSSGKKLEEMYNWYKVQFRRDESLPYSSSCAADIVVVNMDTNGYSSLSNYKNTMYNFLNEFRKENPYCKVIFSYGAMKMAASYTTERNAIRAAVEEFGGAANNVYSFAYTLSRDGGDGHPTVANDKIMAKELSDFIKSIQ